jgi:uncharacterized membrane protein
MFFVHPAVAWMTPEAKTSLYFRNFMHVSGMIAPMFMFLAGLSIAIIAERSQASGRRIIDTKKRISIRGAEILLLGYALHVFMYFLGGAWGSILRALKVDILHCIGLSMVVIPWIAWPRRGLNYSALILAVLMPILSMAMYRLPVETILPTFIASYFTTKSAYALFPFIPYAAWMMFGVFFGPIFLKSIHSKSSEKRFWTTVVIAAILMWATGKGLKFVYYAFFLDTLGTDKSQIKGVPHYFWMKGAVILLLLLAGRITSSLFERFTISFWTEFGRFSLFSYCIHLLIIYPLAGSFLYNRLSPFGHLVGSAALTVAMFGLIFAWKRLRKLPFRRVFNYLRHRSSAE